MNNLVRLFSRLSLDPLALKFSIVIAGILLILLIALGCKRSLAYHVKDSSKRYAAQKIVTFATFFIIVIFVAIVFKDVLGDLDLILSVAAGGLAFALKEVIVSLAGWISITFGNLYKTGDRVQVGNITGDVIDIGFIRTTLMELGDWVKGDLYTGRIVRVPNSSVFSQPLFNYSGDFQFLWDEITLPIKYGSDYKLAKEVFQKVASETIDKYITEAEDQWQKLSKNYLVEHIRTSPMVTLFLNDNWMEFTVRYIVNYKQRRAIKDQLFSKILEVIDQSKDKLALASATFHLVETPVIDVRVHSKS